MQSMLYSFTALHKPATMSKNWQMDPQMSALLLINLILTAIITATVIMLYKQKQQSNHDEQFTQLEHKLLSTVIEKLSDNRFQLQQSLNEHRASFDKRQMEILKIIQDSLQQGRQEIQSHLKDISGQVEKRLSDGFEKTTKTFTDIIKRLALIDEAQKKITELSGNVVNLQTLLSDKRSRGAFGEVQLNALIRNVLPENHFSFQHVLSNGKRADCIMFLPEPTGNIAIDAKFPLENFQKLNNAELGAADRKSAEQQFKQDIKFHIQSIAEKYILPGETADGAIMFIPAEAIFAEIHSHYPELVELSHKAKVWLVSPTTMMAILTTARAVLKDDATRKQVHIIKEHLNMLAKDFDRFQKRMDGLQRHIDQAQQDVADVNKSARKISSRFSKIEKVELEQQEKLDASNTPV